MSQAVTPGPYQLPPYSVASGSAYRLHAVSCSATCGSSADQASVEPEHRGSSLLVPSTSDRVKAVDVKAFSYSEPASQTRFVIARPADRPDLWEQYLAGVQRAYESFGVEAALALDALPTEGQLPMIAVALDSSGRVVAGTRAHGAFERAEEAHILTEFASDARGCRLIGEWIEERLPDGVIEVKGGWVSPDAQNRRELSKAVARSFLHLLWALNARYSVGAVANHSAPLWSTVGARFLEEVQPVAYPDGRYQTRMMYWDQQNVRAWADDRQAAAIDAERALLVAAQGSPGDQVACAAVPFGVEPVRALGQAGSGA